MFFAAKMRRLSSAGMHNTTSCSGRICLTNRTAGSKSVSAVTRTSLSNAPECVSSTIEMAMLTSVCFSS